MSVLEALIHPSAVVSPRARIASDVRIGPGAIIEENVEIAAGCVIGSCVLLGKGSRLQENIHVHHGAVIGSPPQDLKYAGEPTAAVIGRNTVIREYATVNRGTKERGETMVGENCLLMAYSHVAHDCVIGTDVILANAVNLAGHVEVDDYAIIGGVVPVHQFVKIGKHAMIGGGYRVPQDVCPYSLVAGYPLKVAGLNVIGLRRRGFAVESIRALEAAFKLLFFSNLNTTQAVERITAEVPSTPETLDVLDFVGRSSRGMVK